MRLTMTPAEIWKKLTPSQRVTLLEEAGVPYGYPKADYSDEDQVRAGIRARGASRTEWSSGAARHALGRKGLLDIGQTVAAPTTFAGFHTPRTVTTLGREVADYGQAILRGSAHSTKKTASQLDAEIREILARSSGERIALPQPPPSIRTDRQRKNWYWRKTQAAQKHLDAIARSDGVDSQAFRDADAVHSAFEREWEWYSALLQENDE